MAKTLYICIGAQKAGTTWLADYMRARPDVHMPPVKEVHYFDARFVPAWCARYEAEMLAEFQASAARMTLQNCADPALHQKLAALLLRLRMIGDPDGYLRFMSWGAGDRPVLFEATPDYSMLDEQGFAAMRSVHPDVRLVFLLRNPADRFWSSLRFNRTHNPDFDMDAMFDKLIGREDFVLLADYGRTIRAARAAFGADRLHIEFYERLFTQDAVDRIARFAGLAPTPADFSIRSNASSAGGSMPPDRRRAAINAYAHVYREIEALFKNALPENWRADIALL